MTLGTRLVSAAKSAAATAKPKAAKPVVVKPVLNAMRILRYLAQVDQPSRAMDVARKLSINPSTCYNILRTLVLDGVVEFDELSKTYFVGTGLTHLAERFVTDARRLEAARAKMQKVAARLNVTVTLWRRSSDDRITLVGVEASPANLRITLSEGHRVPVLMGASGRLFAQQLGITNAALRKRFKQIRWARPLSFETYCEEMDAGQQRGWTVDDGYFANGILTVAAPVRDTTGAVVFTVSAVTFRGQFDKYGVERLGHTMKELGESLAGVLI